MTSDLTKIKARILALSAKTVKNGCTEEEAMTAISMVGKLLQQYNLSMDEVELRAEECNTLVINTGSKVRGGVYFAVAAIGSFTGCKVWINRSRFELNYSFFGQESDLLMAKYLYDLIVEAIKTESVKFKKTSPYIMAKSKKAATSSFTVGMGSRVATRLNNTRKENEKELITARGGNTALVVLKSKIVDEAYRDLGLKLSKNNNKTKIYDGSAYRSGQAAGDRVNLNRPVNGPGEKTLQICG